MYLALNQRNREGITELVVRPFSCLGDEQALASKEEAADIGIPTLCKYPCRLYIDWTCYQQPAQLIARYMSGVTAS